MKNLLFFLTTFISFQIISAQEVSIASSTNLYNTAGIEVKPEFPGGIEQFYKFIGENYKVPTAKDFLGGKVFVSFVIEKDGSVTDMKVLRDVGFSTGKEALRVLELCPKWTPGRQNGQNVRCL